MALAAISLAVGALVGLYVGRKTTWLTWFHPSADTAAAWKASADTAAAWQRK